MFPSKITVAKRRLNERSSMIVRSKVLVWNVRYSKGKAFSSIITGYMVL